jgi:putative salt-induced outer membrane protein YdiY
MKRTLPLLTSVSLSLFALAAPVSAQSTTPPPGSAPGVLQPADAAPPGWTGSAGAGLAMTSGNNDSSTVNATYDLKRDTGGPLVFKSAGLLLYGKTEDLKTSDRLSLDGRVERNLSDRTSVFGQTQYLRDEFKAIDYLIAPTVGVNRILARSDRTELSADASVGAVWEKNPGLELQTDGAISAGERLTHKLTATTEFVQKLSALWKMDDFADALYVFGVGLAANLTAATQMKVEFLDTYKARPPLPTVQKNDIATLVSFVYKFD